ncbi:putative integral membrane protein [Botrytis fragariae]|uniref:Putative integral membrane protein n=1 Tax=Botrytis fragariae TaxID=1964551 RepID=A0A8H6EH93_9HELO|nr:putative integral membrane protein [Botrytis fragariae]KAF5872207.1 putative integral membrane protein [Botrytis fragariae]
MTTVSTTFSPEYLAQYRGNTPIAICVTFIVLEIVFVALRYCARWVGKAKWGMDDFLMIPALILCLEQCGVGIAFIIVGGGGYHSARGFPTEQIIKFHQLQFSIAISYFSAVLFPKLAILAIYLRLFDVKRGFRIVTWIIGAFMIANWIGTTVAMSQICHPVQFFWNQKIPGGGKCFNIVDFLRWSSFMNIITDLAMLVLPIPVVLELQMSKKMKAGLVITFALGSLGLVTSIIRFVGFFTSNAVIDPQWAAAPLVTWTILETGTYFIAACLPTLRPLAVFLWKRNPLSQLRSRSAVTKNSGTGGSIALQSRGKAGFKTFDDDSNELIDSKESHQWVSSTTDVERGTRSSRSDGITIKRSVDVTSQ